MRKTDHLNSIEEMTWQNIRAEVLSLNPELTEIIDDLNPDDSLTLFKVRYPFGAKILKHGTLYLPNKLGQLVPITDSSILSHIKEKLGYNLFSNPATFVLKNVLELFVETKDRSATTIPLYGHEAAAPGRLFGIQSILSGNPSYHPKFIWDMSAGARSLFMLPKISEVARHNKLKKLYSLQVDAPKNLLHHWQVFREIAASEAFLEPWHVELLYFSKKWFNRLNDPAWLRFSNYLYKLAWKGSTFWRNRLCWDLVFSLIHQSSHVRTSRYIDETVRHLLAMSTGAVCGFSPATDSTMAPIKGLQEVYLNEYNLKEYHPTIMQPSSFDLESKNTSPIYYSLRFANAAEFSKPNERISLITEMSQIASLLKRYIHELLSGKFNLKTTLLDQAIRQVAFDFYHINPENYSNIIESKYLVEHDNRFLQAIQNDFVGVFPEHSPFFKGCIKVSRKQ